MPGRITTIALTLSKVWLDIVRALQEDECLNRASKQSLGANE